jgi:hypothetical protein
MSRSLVPFKVGDSISVKLRRGGGWHALYDCRIEDPHGKVLLYTSGSGNDDWADGWTVATGKVVRSEHDANATVKSERQTHALELARGTTRVGVAPEKCVVVRDGADRYLVAGSAISWVGLRPPDSVDYRSFSLIRW